MPPELADPETIISEAESERESIAQDATDAYQWFADHIGQMVSRSEAIDAIADHLDCEPGHANRVVANLIDDAVDPVQQIRANGTKWVGIIDYVEYPDSGAYGYVNYDDTTGRHKRLVCAKCVESAETPSDVSTATAGTGSLPADASYDQLLNRVTSHYASNHEEAPEDIEIGASLVSGTTINSNKAFHAGNDGLNSGLDADTVQGEDVVTEIDTHKSSSQDVHGVGTDNAVASDQDITDHTSNDVHNLAQPAQSHDNAAHSSTFAIEGSTNVEDFVSTGSTGDSFFVKSDGSVSVESPSADTDVHAFGGAKHNTDTVANVNTLLSDGQIPTGVDSLVTASDSPYLASGDNLVLVDTSTGTVTVDLPSAGATQGNKIRVVDIAGSADSNNITIQTESSETIEPGGASSATISVAGAWLDLYPDGSNWYAQNNMDVESVNVSGKTTTDTLEATDEFAPPVVATEADLPDPANVPEGAETTVLSDPNGDTSVYKVVDS